MNRSKRSTRNNVNNNIRAKKVRCIDKDNKNIGIIPTFKALNLAAQDGLDLVQVSQQSKSSIPTCKILDYGKFKYDLSKREKANNKKQKDSVIKIKEIKFRPSTGEHDLEIKANKTKKFLSDGHRVKITMMFKGREKMNKDFANDKFNLFLKLVGDLDHTFNFISFPKMDGKSLTCMLENNINKPMEKAS